MSQQQMLTVPPMYWGIFTAKQGAAPSIVITTLSNSDTGLHSFNVIKEKTINLFQKNTVKKNKFQRSH